MIDIPPNRGYESYNAGGKDYQWHSSLKVELEKLEREKLEIRSNYDLSQAASQLNRGRMESDFADSWSGISRNESHPRDVENCHAALDYFRVLEADDRPIRSQQVYEIHAKITDGIVSDPGRLRSETPQSRYPSHVDLPRLMQDYGDWLGQATEEMRENAILLSSVAHCRLTQIHPFADGNGRTARMVMALILCKAGYPLVSIPQDFRPDYLDAVETSDAYEIGGFMKLTIMAVQDGFERYRDYAKRINSATVRTKRSAAASSRPIETQLTNKYNILMREIELLKSSFEMHCELFAENDKNLESWIWKFPRTVGLDQFRQLAAGQPAKQTNLFTVNFRRGREKIRYALYLEYAPSESRMSSHADVVVAISRGSTNRTIDEDEWNYVPLDEIEGVRNDVRKLGYSPVTRKWLVRLRDQFEEMNLEEIAPKFFEEVARCDFESR